MIYGRVSTDDAERIELADVKAGPSNNEHAGTGPVTSTMTASKIDVAEMLITVCYCVMYMLVGPALILVNKHIMKDLNFHFPMLVSGIGQLSSAAGSAVLLRLFKVQRFECEHLVSWHFYMVNLNIVGAANAASLVFGNAGYLFLTVSFVQILKAFTPVFVVVMLYATGVETPSKRVAASVVMMSAATAIASAGELNFDITGMFIMCLAETCEATRLVLTQKLLTNLKFPALEGLYYMSPLSSFWMFGLAALLEVPKALRENAFRLVLQYPGPWLFGLSAILGFLVNVASFLVIRRTSSILLKVMGTARNAGLVLFSGIFLGEVITPLELGGYALCLTFFGAYNYWKMNNMLWRIIFQNLIKFDIFYRPSNKPTTWLETYIHGTRLELRQSSP